MLNLIIFGPPGSGKGTQSNNIIKKYGVQHISTGDLLRDEIRSGSELGKQISLLIDGGNLVPDEMVKTMVEDFITKNQAGNGFIFDGFPRTVNQAQWLRNLLATLGSEIKVMISLEVDDQELKKRLAGRGKELGRPDDQDDEIIRNRLEIYHTRTKVVKDFYRKLDKHIPIQGIGTMEEVFERICTAIDK
ncbi:MAG: adenylate kinase [Salinivirgaceae bacterium]|nr:adenylate kinase [Salinivirgaceae bacterium]